MNFIVSDRPAACRSQSYPVLLRSRADNGNGVIVLFVNASEGMRLRDDGFGPKEGGWISADSTSQWEPFTGTITVTP